MTIMLKTQIKCFKWLHAPLTAVIVEESKFAAWSRAMDVGVETVAFTFLLWNIKYEVITCESVPLRVEKINDIKKKLQEDHNVTLTQQMTNALNVYAEGKTPDFVNFPPDATATAAATLAPIPAPAAAPAPIPASAPDDAQADAQPDAAKSHTKRKLWEKIQQAKKAKT